MDSTTVHVAISKGPFPMIAMTLLLHHDANPNAPDNLGRTALHLASYRRGITEVESLLECGANMDVRDENGWTPLHEAAYWGSVQVAVVLLNRGARSACSDLRWRDTYPVGQHTCIVDIGGEPSADHTIVI